MALSAFREQHILSLYLPAFKSIPINYYNNEGF